MNRWFRFYGEVLDDHKVQSLTPELFKAWVNLLCVASRNNGVLPSIEKLAFSMRVSAHEMQSRIDDLVLFGLLDILTDGQLEPHNWPERQFTSDTSVERTRKYRERRKQKPCDVTVTATVTPPDTDTDTDTDTEREVTPLPPKGAKRVRGTRLPEDWELPEDWRQWALVNCPAASLEMVNCEALKFANHWQAKPGASACKLDWRKTFQNWCLTAFSRAPLRPAGGYQQAASNTSNWHDERRRKTQIILALARGETVANG